MICSDQEKNFFVPCLISILLLVSIGFINCAEAWIGTPKKVKHYNKGVEYLNQENYNAAIIEFRNALKIDPNNSEANYHLGTCYLATSKIDQALKTFDKAIQLNPHLLKARLEKAFILLLKKESPESLKEIEFVLR